MAATEPVAVVTGTSAGIGLHTAVGLARHGVRVVATMRDPARSGPLLDEAARAGVDLDLLACDVIDDAQATACIDEVLARHGRLDILINNAGQGHDGTLEELSLDDLRAQLEVNFFGVARMTKLVLPSMRLARFGRIVSVSSIAGAVGQPFNDAYCASKFAMEGLMQSLSIVVAEFGIGVSVVEPGPVATGFVDSLHEPSGGAPGDDPYARARAAFAAVSAGGFSRAQSAESAAAVVVEAALTSEPRFRWQTSKMASTIVGYSLADTDGATVASRLGEWIV